MRCLTTSITLRGTLETPTRDRLRDRNFARSCEALQARRACTGASPRQAWTARPILTAERRRHDQGVRAESELSDAGDSASGGTRGKVLVYRSADGELARLQEQRYPSGAALAIRGCGVPAPPATRAVFDHHRLPPASLSLAVMRRARRCILAAGARGHEPNGLVADGFFGCACAGRQRLATPIGCADGPTKVVARRQAPMRSAKGGCRRDQAHSALNAPMA